MTYTVKQLSDLAGVSRRTLHYYDEIGLLQPSSHGANGYRHYDETALLRLQQIMFFRELELSLEQIREIMGRTDFDLAQTLRAHRRALHQRTERLQRLMHTVDKTLSRLKGETIMADRDLYEGFEQKQVEYEKEARERWGDEMVGNSIRRWNSYGKDQQKAIMTAGDAITRGIRDRLVAGDTPDAPEVQRLVEAWQAHIGFFYECTDEIFAGLGQMYVEDPRFAMMYRKVYHPQMPEFFSQAIAHYCNRKSGAS